MATNTTCHSKHQLLMRHERARTVKKTSCSQVNPPYSHNVETKVGKCFLQLIDQHFPKTDPLQKIFNRYTLKLSYSCMSNVKTIFSSHNKAQINKPSTTVIADKRIPAHLREIVTSGTLSIKQRSRLHRQKNYTSDCVNQQSRNATET